MAIGMWDLDADPAKLDAAATGWSTVQEQLTGTAGDVDTASKAVVKAGWEGDDADAYDEHRRLLVKDIDKAATAAGKISTHLGLAAGSLRTAQADLDES